MLVFIFIKKKKKIVLSIGPPQVQILVPSLAFSITLESKDNYMLTTQKCTTYYLALTSLHNEYDIFINTRFDFEAVLDNRKGSVEFLISNLRVVYSFQSKRIIPDNSQELFLYSSSFFLFFV